MRYKGLKIISRSAWHPSGNRGSYFLTPPNATTFIHHSASDYGDIDSYTEQCAVMRNIDRQHLAQGWSGIGYNFVVFMPYKRRLWHRPRIFEGRGLDRVPAAQVNHNTGNIAVCVIGNFQEQEVPDSVVDKLVSLCRRLPGTRIAGHRDVNQTSCPGENLYDKLPEIRKRVNR